MAKNILILRLGNSFKYLNCHPNLNIKRKLMDKALILETETHSLDDIEALMELFKNLQDIRISLSSERVLNELPSPVAELRRELNLRYDVVYLNWGGISPSTNYVIDRIKSWESKIDRLGPVSLYSESILETSDTSQNVLNAVRETVSKLIGCKPDEVILTRNTTHGIYLVLQALDFPPKGSRETVWILLTNCEHDTVRYCVRQLEKRFNIKHETIDLSYGLNSKSIAEEIISKCTNKKVKIVILSHITYNTGQVLNVADIINEVKKVLGDKSPLFLVDGAQAVGHIPVDVNALGCDFYAADAHKWLYGPRGNGFLFVKESYLNKHHDSFDFLENYMVETRFRPIDETSKRIFEPATMKVETYIGMQEAIEKFLSLQNVNYERIKLLSQKFRNLIQKELATFDVHISNADPISGIIGVMFRSQRDVEFYKELRKKLNERFNILVRAIENPPSLRFCISSLNSEWEISYAVSALKRLLTEMTSPVKIPKVEKTIEPSLIKQKALERIEEYYAEAMAVLTTRLREAEKRYSDFSMIMRSRELYQQTLKQLESKRKEFLEYTEGITSEKEIQEIEKKLIGEFNKILYGEK